MYVKFFKFSLKGLLNQYELYVLDKLMFEIH